MLRSLLILILASTWDLPPTSTEYNANINGDCAVDVQDLIEVILHWGECPEECCRSDLNRDGSVDVLDMMLVIEAWSDV